MTRFVSLFFLSLLFLTGCSPSNSKGPNSIGRDQTWFPLNLGQKTANINAFTNALVQEISKEEKTDLQIYDVSWDQLFTGLSQKEFAGIFTGLSPNVENNEKFSFSAPFLFLGPVLVLPEKSTVHSLAEMKDKLIGVNQFDDS
ncbi:MAG: substrate-binding periplasmic protein, partial [Chlamydiales bacterium]